MRYFITFLIYSLTTLMFMGSEKIRIELENLQCIYSHNTYCAFPSIIQFKESYYVAFREAKYHRVDTNYVDSYGRILILKSKDGKKWNKIDSISSKETDFRDPKFALDKENELYLTFAGRNKEELFNHTCRTYYYNLQNKKLTPCVIRDCHQSFQWIWETRWADGYGYGFMYGDSLKLVKTSDGKNYVIQKEFTTLSRNCSEVSLCFIEATMYAIIRGEDNTALFGRAEPPYMDWEINPIDIKVGGPCLVTDDGNLLLGTRDYGKMRGKTMIYALNRDTCNPLLLLPSTTNSSYPSIIFPTSDLLWCVYYSGNDTASNIYLAKIKIIR